MECKRMKTSTFWLFILAMSCLLTNLPSITQAQGIKFEEGLSWAQLKEKAKLENKYIFVDCFTTWCGPCKAMDKDVYPNDSVGDFFNKKFVSVKMQIDKTDKDNEAVKQRYSDVEFLEKKYKIAVYPSYLFFSPEGALVHKEVGLKLPAEFIAVAQTAIIPGKRYEDPFAEYNHLLSVYKLGKKNYAKLPYMIDKAREAREWEIMNSLTRDYYKHLQTLPVKKVYTKENLSLISSQLQSSKDPFFFLFFPDGKKANQIMDNNFFAAKVVDNVIIREEADPLLGSEGSMTGVYRQVAPKAVSEPDWNQLYNTIKLKYNEEYAARNVLTAKIKWYGNYHMWSEWINSNIEKIEKFGTDTTDGMEDAMLNGVAWKIFLESNEPNKVNSAIHWMEGVARRHCCIPMGTYWDTYANLLHKAGRTAEALPWEEKALRDAEEYNDKTDIKTFTVILRTMRTGKPTWVNYDELIK